MSYGFRLLVATLTASTTLVMFVGSAAGQEIRTYGDQGSDSGGSGGGGNQTRTVYPGQPQPQTQQSGNQQTNQQRQKQQKKNQEEGDQSMESYEIRIHEDSKSGSGGDSRKSAKMNRPDNQMYKGIIPGDRDEVDHLKEEQESGRSRSAANRLTWIGFQPKDDKTRVFIQMSRSPDYSVSRRDDGKRVVITLDNAKVSAGNFRRDIDTSYFERALTGIKTKVVGQSTIELHIDLREAKSPTVEAKDDYLYVDFDYDNPRKNESNESGE